MEIKDNRELMRNREREVCRVCGSLTVHVREYRKPTMDCIEFLRCRINELEQLIGDAVLETVRGA